VFFAGVTAVREALRGRPSGGATPARVSEI
jgi:hypothetical protein